MGVGSFVTPIIVGATVGTIWELLTKPDDSGRLAKEPGRKIIAGAVTGAAFGVLKHYFGVSVAIPVIGLSFIVADGIQTPGQPEDHNKRVKRCVGILLTGVLIGYGLGSIPSGFWNGISNRMRFHVNLR
jgi:hypothetical protein